MTILERRVKVLRNNEVPLEKIQWEPHRGSEWTWDSESEMQEHYPRLFTAGDVEDEV